jgi:hypothetical protein
MPVKKIAGWLADKVATVVNATEIERQERLDEYEAAIRADLSRLKQNFNYGAALVRLEVPERDVPVLSDRIYSGFLEKAWSDHRLSDRQKELLAWARKAFLLSDDRAEQLNFAVGSRVYRQSALRAIEDGEISDAEAEHLEDIAKNCGQTTATMTARLFQDEGAAFLQQKFQRFADRGKIRGSEWAAFQKTAKRLGLPKPELLEAIFPPARDLVEHTLAEARDDGEISETEERLIENLLDNIIARPAFADYVRQEIAETKEKQNLRKGVLPSLPPPQGIAMKAGEVLHWTGPAQFVRVRELASGTRVDEAAGQLLITDTRMIFTAAEKSMELSHRKVLGCFPFGNEIEIRSSGRSCGRYIFDHDSTNAVAIWEVAVGKANQTIVEQRDAKKRRHISRDIRQRIWQKYGGRCAECDADTYLEFDHIVPVAKGGSNSEENVQLLCRKCNLAKSDRI